MRKLLFIIVLISIFGCQKPEKTAYVVMNDLFTGFEAKKELEKELIQIQTQQTQLLDSLRLFASTQTGKKQQLTQLTYNQKLQEFQQINTSKTQQYDKQIWLQINQYVQEFGKQQGYTYIYGADGSGSIMYADSTRNITKNILAFINKKYQGN